MSMCMEVRWGFRNVVPALLFVLLPFPSAGQGASQQNEAPLLRTTTSEVLLDFVVRDKNGKIIRDLKPDEAQVFEDGVPQTVRHFELYNGQAEAAAPAAEASSSLANAQQSNAPAAPITVNELRDMSVVSVVIANLDPRERELTQDAMRDFVKNELVPNVYVGVFRMGINGLEYLQPYTNDGEKISRAVEEVTSSALAGGSSPNLGSNDSGRTMADVPGSAAGPLINPALGPGSGIQSILTGNWVRDLHDVYSSSIAMLAPLHNFVEAQAAIPGRKVVLLFMSGLSVSPDTAEALNNIISVANRANVTIYALSPSMGYGTLDSGRTMLQAAANASMGRQLSGATGGGRAVSPNEAVSFDLAEASIHANPIGNLAQLAEGTGGALLPDTLDMRRPLRQAMEGARVHYELTYSPANTSLDGAFRKIEVKVSRPNVTVFARSGYFAVPLMNGREIYPFEVATLKAINTTPDLHQFDMRTATMEFRPGRERNQLAFVFQAPTKDLTVATDEKWAMVHICVTALIKDSKGQVVSKISKDIPYDVPVKKKSELERGTVSFTAPFFLAPGHYTIETAAIDRQSMKASVSRTVLDVDEDSGFSMSDVSVVRSVDDIGGEANPFDPLEAGKGDVTPDLSDVVVADASGNLNFFAIAYPSAPVDASVKASLEIYQDNKLVMKNLPSTVPLDSNGAASMLASVPTAKLQAGRYEAHVLFQYKGERLMKKVDFTLAGASAASN